MWAALAAAGLSLLPVAGCYSPPRPRRIATQIAVVDEGGAPVPGARVDLGSVVHRTDREGRTSLILEQGPALAVITAEGFLPEPVPLGRSDADRTVRVRLLSDAGGARWVMHSAGDVMLGRRYEDPGDDDEPLIPAEDAADGARRVVAPLRRAFAAADVRMINLEGVVSDQPASAAHPSKRVVLRSRSDTVAGLEALGVDVAVMANDHVRDYLDGGIIQTISALAAAGIQHTGATSNPDQPADAPAVVQLPDEGQDGIRVGVLAWTTVDGDADNDDYPDDGDAEPPDLASEDAWQYEERRWWFRGPTWKVPARRRRIGTAWGLFREAEPTLAPAEASEAWASLVAVYPELQDFVARRGHGGAAPWQTDAATAAIEELASSVDVVVVHLHAGYYGQTAPSAFVRQMARDAIDAGAHIVIGHHPHVLQGAEWYKGRLIAYSLGNLVFDLEGPDTAPTAFLRTVWEGTTLVEARLVLLTLDGYRPIPVTDGAARRTARALWERSHLGGRVELGSGGQARLFADATDEDTRVAVVRMRNHGAVLATELPDVQERSLEVPAGATVPLGFDGLVFPVLSGTGMWIGRDLLGWGSFEDQLADGEPRDDARWRVNSKSEEIIVAEDAGAGTAHVRLHRDADNSQGVVVQAIGRIALPDHRLYREEEDKTVAEDGPARYTVRLLARRAGEARPQVRLDLHHLDGSSTRAYMPMDVPADEAWHRVEMRLSEEDLFEGGTRTEEVSLALRLVPPEQGSSWLDVDDLALIEWRRTTQMPERFGAYDFVHNGSGSDQVVVVTGLPIREPAGVPAPGALRSR